MPSRRTTEMRPSSTATSCIRGRSRSTSAPTVAPTSWCSTAATTACCAPSTATAANAIGSLAAGNEMWAFMPPEFYSNIKRLRDNTIPISFTGSPPPPPARSRSLRHGRPDHGLPDTDWQIVFAACAAAAGSLYAFDVTDMVTTPGSASCCGRSAARTRATTPAAPRFDGIGQTWSAPQNLKTNGYVMPACRSPC